MKKVLILLLATLFVLFGCNSASSETLTMVLYSEQSEGNATKKAIDRYTEETGVEIEVIEVPGSDCANKVLTMIQAGDSPDLAYCGDWETIYNATAESGQMVVPLTDVVDESTLSPTAAAASYKTDLETGEQTLMAFPGTVTSVGLIANTTITDAAGVTLPTVDDVWTWEEYIVALEQVDTYCKDSGACDYAMVIDKSTQRLNTILAQFDQTHWSEDGNSQLVNSPDFVAVIDKFVSLFEDGYIPTSTWVGTEDPTAMFKTGRVGFHWSGSWMLSDYKDSITTFEYQAVPMPQGTNRATIAGGNMLYVLNTDQVEASKDFVAWFATPENYAIYCAEASTMPSITGLEVAWDESIKEDMMVFQNELEASDPKYTTNGKNVEQIATTQVAFWDVLKENVVLAISGDMTPQEACDAAAAFYEDVLAGG